MQNLHFLTGLSSKSQLQHIFVRLTQKNIINWSEELQLECGSGLLITVQKGVLPDDLKVESIELALTFLSFYSRTLHQRWLPVYTTLLPLIPNNIIRTKLIPELMLLSDFSQKAITRQVSCHLLANLATVIGKDFKGPLLQRVKSLSQDTNPEVREEMCKVWIDIIRAVGKNVLEETIFFDILKLIEDEVEAVKCGGIKLLINILEIVSESFFEKEIAQVLVDHVYSLGKAKVDEVVCENLGMLVVGSHGMKSENLGLLKKMMGWGVEFRKSLAFNFPGIVQISGLSNELKEIAVGLSGDSSVQVREIFAAGFHEVLILNKHCKILKKIANKLVEDTETRLIVFKRLNQWTALYDPTQLLIKFIKLMTTPLEWRVQVSLLTYFQDAFGNFSLKEVLDHLVPLLLHKMLAASWPVKKKAANTLALIVKNTYYICRKLDLCNIIKEKLAHSKSSYDRVLFVYFAEHMARICSKKFFFRHFFEEFLNMANDKTQNVLVQFLSSCTVVAMHTAPDLLLAKTRELESYSQVIGNLAREVAGFLGSKEFELKFSENLQKDRGKEMFEMQQELQEAKEQENNKRKVVDELGLKISADPGKGKKVPIKGKVQSESIDPKSRGTRSTAIIKAAVPVKRK